MAGNCVMDNPLETIVYLNWDYTSIDDQLLHRYMVNRGHGDVHRKWLRPIQRKSWMELRGE